MTAGTFPPYTHTPGVTPHPVSDPAGHAFGLGESIAPWPNRQFADHPLYARGWELFSAGYYWESHEAWEGVWKAVGRLGPEADFLKGLIKLAAAGVKAREGNSGGVSRHATRGAELFCQCTGAPSAAIDPVLVSRLRKLAEQIIDTAGQDRACPHGRPVVFWTLQTEEPNSSR